MVRGLSCPFTSHLTGAWDVVQYKAPKWGKKAKNEVKYVGNNGGFYTRLASLADFLFLFPPMQGLVQG